MTPTLLTPTAKDALSKTIRSLRSRLLESLTESARGEYQLDVKLEKSQLPEARRCKRERLEAWLDEQARASKKSKAKPDELRKRFLHQAVKEAAHTWLNRLVFMRILEHHGLLQPAVITGGWDSPAYAQEFVHYAGPLGQDDSRGYLSLLHAVFGELALDLPGLYGPVGLVPLFPMPAAMLRELVEALNDKELESAWGDDTTLGWIYQYWNDPEREALDAKINDGGKIEPHEIASKTQMFTERYMVEWLLQNSLGLTWLCICKKNGWTPDADAVLPVLDARRAEWRQKRDAGEVALDALMPIHGPLEDAWKYYVPQPIPEDAIAKAPSSIRDLKLLDPACGSGHFLVIAFGLLAALYFEEARHRGESWSPEQITEWILENNLHGVDIDPRAIQIAAAALYLKARTYTPAARIRQLNLVAPTLQLGNLPDDDASVVQLRHELKREVGIPEELTKKLVSALAGVDHLGTLLKVDAAINEALEATNLEIERTQSGQGDLFAGFAKQQVKLDVGEAKATVLEKLEQFLGRHSSSEDLGLRLDGEQLAAGVRFVRMVKEGTYDVVVGNPPYQGLSKTAFPEYLTKRYPKSKADLYSAFLERSVELSRDGGCSGLVTMQGWMFLGQFAELRQWLIEENCLRSLADLRWCAFEIMRHATVSMAVIARGRLGTQTSVAICPSPRDEREESIPAFAKKKAGVLCQVGRCEFDPKGFEVIEGEPIVYWWSPEFLEKYSKAPKLGSACEIRQGMATTDNARFLRLPWEPYRHLVWVGVFENSVHDVCDPPKWVPYIKGAAGSVWFESLGDILNWSCGGLEVKVCNELHYGSYSRNIKNEDCYFRRGIAFTAIGANFSARSHRVPSVIGNAGLSAFTSNIAETLGLMNRSESRAIMSALNPTVNFLVGDVCRLPIFHIADSDEVFRIIECAFSTHESHREPSVEFKSPGPSPWRYAQDWAQRAVDRAEGEPLPPYEPEFDPPEPESFVSFAIGVALGRFGAEGEGILSDAPESALPAGILFVTADDTLADSLSHPAAANIRSEWDKNQNQILKGKKQDLRDWLRKDFFTYHKGLYENRPIYFPLSSEKRSFVAYVSVHRWADNTLQTLLADHLNPALRKLDGQIADLNQARASSDKKQAAAAEKQYGTISRLRDELADFIKAVSQCAERGAPDLAPEANNSHPKIDAPFHMNLDDGVMINSAALWPLLAPQWADPKKWWKQLCESSGKKDYDWAHLAKRYFPTRVDEKCKADPSLAVAHGCFWKYHPGKAYAWELRLQDEIRPEFTIEEQGAQAAREAYLREYAEQAQAAYEKEMVRRERKAAKAGEEASQELDFGASEEDADG